MVDEPSNKFSVQTQKGKDFSEIVSEKDVSDSWRKKVRLTSPLLKIVILGFMGALLCLGLLVVVRAEREKRELLYKNGFTSKNAAFKPASSPSPGGSQQKSSVSTTEVSNSCDNKRGEFQKCEVDTNRCITTEKYKGKLLKGIVLEDGYLEDGLVKGRQKHCYTPDDQDLAIFNNWDQQECLHINEMSDVIPAAGWNLAGIGDGLCFARMLQGNFFHEYDVSQGEIATIKQKVNQDEWIEFRSKTFNFGFEYPSQWGEVQEVWIDTTESGAYQGRNYNLKFTGNQSVIGFGSTKDYQAGRGGGLNLFDYLQTVEVPSVDSLIDVHDPGCFTMGGRNSLNGIVHFHLPKEDLKDGITIMVPFLTQNDRKKIEWKFGLTYGDKNAECTDVNVFSAVGRQIFNYLKAGNELERESLEDLFVYQGIAESAFLY